MSSGSPTMNRIERAHQLYRDGKYTEALNYYTDALSLARTNPQKIALHSNRAACYLKLHDFHKAAEECTSVLDLDHKHTGALMLRAQTLVTLKEYHSALFDVHRLIELNPSSEVYRDLHARLKTQLSLATIPEDDEEFEEEEEEEDEDEYIDEANFEENAEEQGDDEEVREFGSKNDANGNSKYDANGDAAPAKTDHHKSESATLLTSAVSTQDKRRQQTDQQSSGWQTIPKPKGHSQLDYSRWNSVEDDSSDDDDDDTDDDDDDVSSLPQYRFRVKTVGVRAVK